MQLIKVSKICQRKYGKELYFLNNVKVFRVPFNPFIADKIEIFSGKVITLILYEG